MRIARVSGQITHAGEFADLTIEASALYTLYAPNVQVVTMTGTEFTSICPKTGQPDFGTVIIEYEPRELCIESKALKYYLWSYRDAGAFCESLAAQIADDVVYAIKPKSLTVRVTQNVRGGIALVAEARR